MIRNVNTHTHTRYNNYISIQFSLFFCVCGVWFILRNFTFDSHFMCMRKHIHAPSTSKMHTHTMIKFYFITFARFFHLNRFGNHRLLPCTDCSVFNEHMKWDWSIFYKQRNFGWRDTTAKKKRKKNKQFRHFNANQSAWITNRNVILGAWSERIVNVVAFV